MFYFYSIKRIIFISTFMYSLCKSPPVLRYNSIFMILYASTFCNFFFATAFFNFRRYYCCFSAGHKREARRTRT